MAFQESGTVFKSKTGILTSLQNIEDPEEMWDEIRSLIINFFAERAITFANRVV